MSQSSINTEFNLKKGEIFLLPTNVLKDLESEEDFDDYSSGEEIINDNEVVNNPDFLTKLCNAFEQFGYDLDGRDLVESEKYNNFNEAANFSPFIIDCEAMELEMIVLWDFFGGNTFCDINVLAGDIIFVVAEEYQVRSISDEEFIRLPFRFSLGRWTTQRPINPYLGLIPSHYVVSKKFYDDNPFLIKYPVWFQGNCEVIEVIRRIYSDRSALCPGLFAIFSPPWLNPDPRDLRCYFLVILVERGVSHDRLLMDFLKREADNCEVAKFVTFLNNKLAMAMEKNMREQETGVKTSFDEASSQEYILNRKDVIDLLFEIEATPFSPAIMTISRSTLGHYEFMANRYETLYDLVYYLANHRSSLPHKLVYDKLSPDVCQPKIVPPPVARFEKDLKAQPMFIEQWAAMHFDEVTRYIEQNEKSFFVTKSVFDNKKKLHERMLRKLNLPVEEADKIVDFILDYARPKNVKDKKKATIKEKKQGTKPWSDLPPHDTSIYLKSTFSVGLDRISLGTASLGAGAFGSVQIGSFMVRENVWLPAAIKKLKLYPDNKGEKNPAFNEIDILQMICHPNIVLFHAFSIDSSNRTIFLVFELMDTSLDKFVEKSNGKISENERMDILAQICRGMSFLHTRTPSIIHGDLAARNVLLKKHPINKLRYVAKVTDFGLSKLCPDDMYTTYPDPNKIPYKWLPPEVLGPRILTTKADVWAFGMVCFEIYGIGEPYGILPSGKVYQYLNDGYRFDRLPEMSPCILDISLQCWRKQAVDRPTFSELEKKFDLLIIEEDEEDERIRLERENEFLKNWKQKKRKEKINKILEGKCGNITPVS